MHRYDHNFFDYINAGSARSAAVIVPMLIAAFGPQSVLDVGCGQGAWLQTWRGHGVDDVQGLDGPYVDQERLLIPHSQFASADLSRPFDLGRRFDLVQCLEVAEHLPRASAEGLVRSLQTHGSVILFSAATPDQGARTTSTSNGRIIGARCLPAAVV